VIQFLIQMRLALANKLARILRALLASGEV
jgi:hypothetical protein